MSEDALRYTPLLDRFLRLVKRSVELAGLDYNALLAKAAREQTDFTELQDALDAGLPDALKSEKRQVEFHQLEARLREEIHAKQRHEGRIAELKALSRGLNVGAQTFKAGADCHNVRVEHFRVFVGHVHFTSP